MLLITVKKIGIYLTDRFDHLRYSVSYPESEKYKPFKKDKKMIAQLPDNLKEKAIELIRSGRFSDAKALHDNWIADNDIVIEYRN